MKDDAVLWLEDLRAQDWGRVGGKLARLGDLAARGHRVPPAFVLPVGTARAAMSDDSQRAIGLLLNDVPADRAALTAASARVKALIEEQPLPAWIAGAIRGAYERLATVTGIENPVTAVRSSGASEDGAESSFAGQFDTYLGISGAASVAAHVKKCWASQYNERALQYLRRQGELPDARGIAVGVLALVRARSAGIAFSVDPVSGRRDRVIIEANWGLGETVVSGRVTPDRWVVDKETERIVEAHIAHKPIRMIYEERRAEAIMASVPAHDCDLPSLSREEVTRVARTAIALEREEGVPIDIEWAFETSAIPPNDFYLLQYRPVTGLAPLEGDDAEPFDPVQYALKSVFGVTPRKGN